MIVRIDIACALAAHLITLARAVKIVNGVPEEEGTYQRKVDDRYGAEEKSYSNILAQKQSTLWRIYSDDYEEAWNIHEFIFYVDAALTVQVSGGYPIACQGSHLELNVGWAVDTEYDIDLEKYWASDGHTTGRGGAFCWIGMWYGEEQVSVNGVYFIQDFRHQYMANTVKLQKWVETHWQTTIEMSDAHGGSWVRMPSVQSNDMFRISALEELQSWWINEYQVFKDRKCEERYIPCETYTQVLQGLCDFWPASIRYESLDLSVFQAMDDNYFSSMRMKCGDGDTVCPEKSLWIGGDFDIFGMNSIGNMPRVHCMKLHHGHESNLEPRDYGFPTAVAFEEKQKDNTWLQRYKMEQLWTRHWNIRSSIYFHSGAQHMAQFKLQAKSQPNYHWHLNEFKIYADESCWEEFPSDTRSANVAASPGLNELSAEQQEINLGFDLITASTGGDILSRCDPGLPCNVVDNNQDTYYKSLCADCIEEGFPWVVIDFGVVDPKHVKCVRIHQGEPVKSPTVHGVREMELSYWDTQSGVNFTHPDNYFWHHLFDLPEMDNGFWQRRPALAGSMWRFTNKQVTAGGIRIVGFRVYTDKYCEAENLVLGNLSTNAHKDSFSPANVFDAVEPEFQSLCKPCQTEGWRFDIDFVQPTDLNCFQIWTTIDSKPEYFNYYRWSGSTWYQLSEFCEGEQCYDPPAELVPGRWSQQPQSLDTIWRLANKYEMGNTGWGISRIHVYGDAQCSEDTEFLPGLTKDFVSFGDGWKLNIGVSPGFAHSDGAEPWTSSCHRHDTATGNVYPNGRVEPCAPQTAWFAMNFGINKVNINCIRVNQYHKKYNAGTLIVQTWDGYGYEDRWELQNLWAGSFARRPGGANTIWRARAMDAVPDNWAVRELRFHSDKTCTHSSLITGDPIHSGSENRPSQYAYDGTIISSYVSRCAVPDGRAQNGCDAGQAWLGVDAGIGYLGTAFYPRCMRIWQSGDPNMASRNINIESWSSTGQEWILYKELTGMWGGSWCRRPAATYSQWRVHVVPFYDEVFAPENPDYEEPPLNKDEGWAVEGMEFYSDGACQNRMEISKLAEDPIMNNEDVPSRPISGFPWMRGNDLEQNQLYVARKAFDDDETTAFRSHCPRSGCTGYFFQGDLFQPNIDLWLGADFGPTYDEELIGRVQCIRILQPNNPLTETEEEYVMRAPFDLEFDDAVSFDIDGNMYVPEGPPKIDNSPEAPPFEPLKWGAVPTVEVQWWDGYWGEPENKAVHWRTKSELRFTNLWTGTWNRRPAVAQSYWRVWSDENKDWRATWQIEQLIFATDVGCNSGMRIRSDMTGGENYIYDDNWVGIDNGNLNPAWVKCLNLRKDQTSPIETLRLDVWNGDSFEFVSFIESLQDFIVVTRQTFTPTKWRISNRDAPVLQWSLRELHFHRDVSCSQISRVEAIEYTPISSPFRGQHSPSLAMDDDLETSWWSVEQAPGPRSAWVGIEFNGPQAPSCAGGYGCTEPYIRCVRFYQDPDSDHVVSEISLDFYTNSWSVYNFYPYLGRGSWVQRPALPYSMWRINSNIEIPKGQESMVSELLFFIDSECSVKAKVGTVIASRTMVGHGAELAVDDDPTTYWSSFCEYYTIEICPETEECYFVYGCEAGKVWVGIDFGEPQDIKCIRLLHQQAEIPDMLLEHWAGNQWEVNKPMTLMWPGEWLQRPDPRGSKWRVTNGNELRYGWGVWEMEFFEDRYCESPTCKPVVVGLGTSTCTAIASRTDHLYPLDRVFDGIHELGWRSFESTADPYDLYVGIDYGFNMEIVQCVKINQWAGRGGGAFGAPTVLILQRYDGAAWNDVYRWADIPREGQSQLSVAPSTWRIMNGESTSESYGWSIAELQFFNDPACTEELPRLGQGEYPKTLSSGYFSAAAPSLAFDGDQDTEWISRCTGCGPREAYIGLDWGPAPIDVKCFRFMQSRGETGFLRRLALDPATGEEIISVRTVHLQTKAESGEWADVFEATSDWVWDNPYKWTYFPQQSGRNEMWRIRNVDNPQSFWVVHEIMFYIDDECESPLPQNIVANHAIAEGLDAVSIASGAQEGHAISHAFDGSYASTWWSNCMGDNCQDENGGSAWIGLDLRGRPTTISCVRVIQAVDTRYAIQAMTLDRWDGSRWVDAASYKSYDIKFLGYGMAWRIRSYRSELFETKWEIRELEWHHSEGCQDEVGNPDSTLGPFNPIAHNYVQFVTELEYKDDDTNKNPVASFVYDGMISTAWVGEDCREEAEQCYIGASWPLVPENIANPPPVKCVRIWQDVHSHNYLEGMKVDVWNSTAWEEVWDSPQGMETLAGGWMRIPDDIVDASEVSEPMPLGMIVLLSIVGMVSLGVI